MRIIKMSSTNKWLLAASVALLVALGITYVSFNSKVNTQQRQLAALTEKYNQRISADRKLAGELALINHQNTKKVLLNGVAASPASKAVVYWNNLNGRVMIGPVNLPKPPVGKQYQLWALVDGKPVDAGVFDVSTTGFYELKHIASAQAFAITLEEEGGVLSPTLSAMYVMGNV